MRKKFLSVILSLSMVATAVTPCFAVEDQSEQELNESAVTKMENLKDALYRCELNRPKWWAHLGFYAVELAVFGLLGFFCSGGGEAAKQLEKIENFVNANTYSVDDVLRIINGQ